MWRRTRRAGFARVRAVAPRSHGALRRDGWRARRRAPANRAPSRARGWRPPEQRALDERTPTPPLVLGQEVYVRPVWSGHHRLPARDVFSHRVVARRRPCQSPRRRALTEWRISSKSSCARTRTARLEWTCSRTTLRVIRLRRRMRFVYFCFTDLVIIHMFSWFGTSRIHQHPSPKINFSSQQHTAVTQPRLQSFCQHMYTIANSRVTAPGFLCHSRFRLLRAPPRDVDLGSFVLVRLPFRARSSALRARRGSVVAVKLDLHGAVLELDAVEALDGSLAPARWSRRARCPSPCCGQCRRGRRRPPSTTLPTCWNTCAGPPRWWTGEVAHHDLQAGGRLGAAGVGAAGLVGAARALDGER